MRVLVTGGAGYIGSHAVRLLMRAGHDVWVWDNLSRGHRGAVPDGRLIEGELADRPRLEQALRKHRIDAVMHFAAFALVGESVADPAVYYSNNVVSALALLDAKRNVDVPRIVFSSTTATYGVPQRIPITEEEARQPINPYGFTKLVIEHALEDYSQAYGLGFAALRYFNAAGATPSGDLGEDHHPESHLIPIVLQVALGQRAGVTVFGDDYPTPDGTCIRDYIHVDDLGDAHVKALEQLEPGSRMQLNLGTGRGHSVRVPARDRPADSSRGGSTSSGRSAGTGGRQSPSPVDTPLDAEIHRHRRHCEDSVELASRAPRRVWGLSDSNARDHVVKDPHPRQQGRGRTACSGY
jgi:UDP-glucose 4-epimerase